MTNSPTQQLLTTVDKVLSPLMNNNNNANNQRKPARKSRKGKAKQKPQGGSRAQGLSRNPGARVPRDNSLALTRAQFTATSPLNLFETRPGSTPGGIRVRGRELISAVTVPIATGAWVASTAFPGGSGGFSAMAPVSFPRLQSYSTIYEYYVFHKLDILFQSNQPTTQTGEVILSIDYDPTDAAPTSTAQQMRNISSTMANIYSDCSLQMLKSLSRLPKYEAGLVTEALQQVQASLTVAVEGYSNPAISTVGYVIAQYEIEFFTPQ